MPRASAAALDLAVDFRQSNHEGQLVDWIQEARETADGIILNAGAYSHTSIAILDALNAAELPVIEVHLSNIYRRETFRHHSYVSRGGARRHLRPRRARLSCLALAAMARLIARRRRETRLTGVNQSPHGEVRKT